MSMPFMNTVHTNQVTTNNAQVKPLVLNEGQMIHGKIQQLHPGQLAEVQVGSQKMLAKLEVPMRAGDAYYFQVTAVKPEVQLRIISGPIQAEATATVQLNHLMEAMQLPKSAEMMKVLSFILQEKMPMTRENLLQAVRFLQTTPLAQQANALVAIQQMMDLKLPLTDNMFQSILGVESKEGMHANLQALQTMLANDQNVGLHMKDSILQLLQSLKKPFAAATSQTMIGQALQMMQSHEGDAGARFTVLQYLKEAGIVPRQTSLPNFQQVLRTVLAEQINLPMTLEGNLSRSQLADVSQFLSRLSFVSTSQQENLLATMRNDGMQAFSQALTQIISSTLANQSMQLTAEQVQQMLSLLHHDGQTAAQAEAKLLSFLQRVEQAQHAAIQQKLQEAEATVSKAIDGKAMKEAMQMVFRSLGLNYETALLGKEVATDRLMQMLKPQLIALMNDPAASQQVKDMAEQLVARMNAGPLMSMETGVNHQLIMQLPLQFFGKKIDATLQWNGRMQENKKIDADFARILFYLDLHSIQETVVDMQVQNRVVTVTVFNEDRSLEEIGKSLGSKLKDGLESIGYQLSGVFFKNFVAEKQQHQKTAKTEISEGGLDFRI